MGIVIVEGGGGKERFQDGGWRISAHALSMRRRDASPPVAIRAPVGTHSRHGIRHGLRHGARRGGTLIIRTRS